MFDIYGGGGKIGGENQTVEIDEVKRLLIPALVCTCILLSCAELLWEEKI